MFNTIFVYPFLNLLTVIYGVVPGHDFGVAVIIMTLIIRFALWPLTGKQLHSQKKMQALQPEITKIKAQAGGDRQKESAMLMELYKEKEINPFSACLPALFQFPFLIALYFVFRLGTEGVDKFAPHLYSFVANIPYIKDIIANPHVFNPKLFGVVSMAQPSIVLAILAGLTQYVQVKMITPKTQAKDAQSKITANMTLMFPAMTIFIAWNLPAALPLYWLVANLVAIFQQKFIMSQETEKMEEVAEIVSIKDKAITSKPKPKTTKSPTKKKKGKK